MGQYTIRDESICLTVANKAKYKRIIDDNNPFREYILQVLAQLNTLNSGE